MIVAVLIAIRAVLWNLGLEGISTSPLTSSKVSSAVRTSPSVALISSTVP